MSKSELNQGYPPQKDAVVRDVTHADVARIVGSDFSERIHNRLYELNILPQGEKLIFKNPLGNHEEGESHARYLYEGKRGKNRVYIFIISSEWGEKTSKHKHEDPVHEIIENYYQIAGEGSAEILLDGVSHPFDEKHPFISVAPGVAHQMVVTSGYIMGAINMENGALVSDDQVHQPI